jgi:lipid-A-disaccharide synthase
VQGIFRKDLNKSILIIAGEASGDNVGGLLCEEVKDLRPDTSFFGLGGNKMKNAGVDILYHIHQLSFLGFWEVVKHIPFIRSVEKELLREAEKREPALAILIDYPGFNLRFARKLKAMGIPILYYVSPQVWAWGKKRIARIKSLIDKMIVVFEFEKELYAEEGINVDWYGHPLLDMVRPKMSRSDFFNKAGIDEGQRYIGLFPGSRMQEVSRILPVMREAVEMVQSRGMEIKGVIGGVSGIDDSIYHDIVGNDFRVIKNMTYDIMSNADLNLIASGTATLECAILGRPLFVLYKTSTLTYLIARNLVKIPDIGLVNVVAGERIVPEFIQSDCRADKIAHRIKELFENPPNKERMISDLSSVRSRLGEKGSSRRAAKSVLKMLTGAGN